MALNSLLFYQFFVYISPKIVGGHNWDFAMFTPQLHGILLITISHILTILVKFWIPWPGTHLFFFTFSFFLYSEWARKLSAVSLFSTSKIISEYNFVRRKCRIGPLLRRFTLENSLVTLFSTFLNFCYWNNSIVTSHYTNMPL